MGKINIRWKVSYLYFGVYPIMESFLFLLSQTLIKDYLLQCIFKDYSHDSVFLGKINVWVI